MADITIYSTPSCPYCMQAKSLLTSLNIPYKDTDVAADTKVRDDMIEKTGQMTVPIIMNGDELIGGYDDLAKLHAEGTLETL